MRSRELFDETPLPTAMTRMCEPWDFRLLALATAASAASSLPSPVVSPLARGTLLRYSLSVTRSPRMRCVGSPSVMNTVRCGTVKSGRGAKAEPARPMRRPSSQFVLPPGL